MPENKSRVLYNNILRQDGAAFSYSGVGVVGRAAQNAVDWRDFSLFEVDANSTTTLDITLPNGGTIDAWSIYVANYTGNVSHGVELYYESSPSIFTLLGDISAAGGTLSLNQFSEITVAAGRKIRFSFAIGTATMLVRQLVVGKCLEFERGQWVDITSPNFSQGIISDNIISVNGSAIARNIRRLSRSVTISLDLLNKDWMRNFWEPFQAHAARYAFIYQWSPTLYPNEVAFALAKEINPPVQNSRDFMSITMPLFCLIADSNVL